jgi:site-specific recombinase XerD
MARRTQFIPVESPNGWRLNIPAKYTESGSRERHFFKLKKDAEAAAKKLKQAAAEFGHRSQAIRPGLAEDATAAAALLEPWGASLLDAARYFAAAREREAASKPLSVATADWLSTCEHLRKNTLIGYRQTVGKLDAALGHKLLATITTEQLHAAIVKGRTPAVAAHRYRHARAFWRWAAGKGWCQAETLDKVEVPKATSDGEIEILTPSEAATLLAIAAKHFPKAVASYALQLFAGIRTEEITRMEAKHVSADGIELPASVTKKGRRRHITPNATLAAWLAKHPFEPCPNWRRVDRACRYLAGWKLAPDADLVPAKLVRDEEAEAAAREWPKNSLRHSHASYAVAAGVPLEALLFEFGHSGNPAVLRQHYVGRASKKQALEFFAIMPEGVEAPATIQPVESVA